MNLQQLKQEAREGLFRECGHLISTSSPQNFKEVKDYLYSVIDKVVDAVETSVVPELRTGFDLDDDAQNYKWMGQNEAREKVLAAFRNFRGV